MKVPSGITPTYTITINQRLKDIGILVYPYRCRTLNRSLSPMQLVFLLVFMITCRLAIFQEEFLVQTKVSRGSREVHIHPHCLLKNSKADGRRVWTNLWRETGNSFKMFRLTILTRWWQLKYFLISPLFGEDSQFDEHIFQLNWNHQLDIEVIRGH